jgi:hypothetical protein
VYEAFTSPVNYIRREFAPLFSKDRIYTLIYANFHKFFAEISEK